MASVPTPPALQQEVLASVAQVCRDAYILYRTQYDSLHLPGRQRNRSYQPGPRWDGGIDSYGRQHVAVWPRIAAYMIEHGFSPVVCIRYRFEAAGGKNRPVFPNQIALREYIREYRDLHVPVSAEVYSARLLSEAESARNVVLFAESEQEMTQAQAVEYALLGGTLDLSPLFSYCLAMSVQRPELAQVFAARALLQFAEDPEGYRDSQWAPWLPAWLDEALRFVRRPKPRQGTRNVDAESEV